MLKNAENAEKEYKTSKILNIEELKEIQLKLKYDDWNLEC